MNPDLAAPEDTTEHINDIKFVKEKDSDAEEESDDNSESDEEADEDQNEDNDNDSKDTDEKDSVNKDKKKKDKKKKKAKKAGEEQVKEMSIEEKVEAEMKRNNRTIFIGNVPNAATRKVRQTETVYVFMFNYVCFHPREC